MLDFVEFGRDGAATPITSARRRVPALWNILGQFGRTSGFVGWYASYPAERVAGFEVSDRLGFHQVRSARAVAGATFPESLAAELREQFGEPAVDLQATRRRFLADPAAELSPDGAARLDQLARIHATSEFYRRVLPHLQARFATDLLAVYFEGVDACQHLFMEDAPPRLPGVSDADFRAFSVTVDRYYEYQDEVLADLLRLAGPGTVTIVVSDHGFKSGAERPRTSGRADTGRAPLWHRLHGVVFLHGGPAVPAHIPGASILDVAPTVLALLRVPQSRELAGRPLSEGFRAGALREVPSVARYRALPKARPAPSGGEDPEAVQKLMALGYLSGNGRGAAHDADGRTAASFVNEATALSGSGDLDGALRAFGKAVALDPKNVNGLLAAAAIYLRRGEAERARPLIERASAAEPDSFWVHVQRASWAVETGRFPEAESELAAAGKADDRLPILYFAKARLAQARGDGATALQELARARSLTDADDLNAEILLLQAEAHAILGRFAEAHRDLDQAARIASAASLSAARGELALREKDYGAAARHFARALRSSPQSSPLERKLGSALASGGSPAEAEAAFRRAISSARTDPERENAYGDLSLLLQSERKEAEALATLRQAVDRLPRSHVLFGMLGAAEGRKGNIDGAIAAYERSIALKPTALACKTLAALLVGKKGSRDRALSLWKESLEIDPNQSDVRDFLRQFGGGDIPPS